MTTDEATAIIAAADREHAETADFLRKLIIAHRADMPNLQVHGLNTAMETAGALALQMSDRVKPTQLLFLLAVAIDQLARGDNLAGIADDHFANRDELAND
jgi:hypothetical protein